MPLQGAQTVTGASIPEFSGLIVRSGKHSAVGAEGEARNRSSMPRGAYTGAGAKVPDFDDLIIYASGSKQAIAAESVGSKI